MILDYCHQLLDVLTKLEELLQSSDELKQNYERRVARQVEWQAIFLGFLISSILIVWFMTEKSGMFGRVAAKTGATEVFVRMFSISFVALVLGKGTQSVQVNYLDQDTNQPITNFSPSIIKANVGDTIKVLGKQLRDIVDINTFSFLTPEIPGYIFVSAPPLVVANNDSENNVINVTYKKLPIGKAHFNYQYSSDVVDQSILLPTINDTEGEINEAVIMPELPNLPDNYYISKVVTTDGQQYATLKDAISGEKYKNQELHFTLIVSKVVVPTTSDNNSSKQSSTAERKNEQGKQTSKDSTTVNQPQEQETIKKEAIHKNEKPNSESNDTFKEVNKEIDSPLKLPLKMPTEISQMPQSSVVAINNEQSKYPNVSAHNLEIQVAGTAGIFAGGVVAIGTITGFNKFYKFLKIVKK